VRLSSVQTATPPRDRHFVFVQKSRDPPSEGGGVQKLVSK
jgi:hypothetical protein